MFLFHPAIGQLSVFTLAINPLFCLKHNSWNLYIFLAFLHGKRCPEALVLVARSNSEINHEVQWSKFNISTFPICIFYSLNFFSDLSFPSRHWPTNYQYSFHIYGFERFSSRLGNSRRSMGKWQVGENQGGQMAGHRNSINQALSNNGNLRYIYTM